MKRILFAVLAALAFAMIDPALGQSADKSLVFRSVSTDDTPMVMRIFLEKPCTNEKVVALLAAKILPQFLPLFHAAILTYHGRDYASCWIDLNDNVASYDEEGSPLNPPDGIPLSVFKDEAL